MTVLRSCQSSDGSAGLEVLERIQLNGLTGGDTANGNDSGPGLTWNRSQRHKCLTMTEQFLTVSRRDRSENNRIRMSTTQLVCDTVSPMTETCPAGEGCT